MIIQAAIMIIAVLALCTRAVAVVPTVAVERVSVETQRTAAGEAGQVAARAESGPATRSAETITRGNPLWSIPLDQLSATRERPLFAPSRRPPPPVVAVPTVAAPPPAPAAQASEPPGPEIQLIGTVVGESESIGVFIEKATKKAVMLKRGHSHDGWKLNAVQRRAVTLHKERQVAVLLLPAPEGPRSAPRPAKTPPTDPPRSGLPPPSPQAPSLPVVTGVSQLFGAAPEFVAPSAARGAVAAGAGSPFAVKGR
jgi:hypothetical protein